MTGEELKRAAIELFGERGWVSALSVHLGVHRTQVWRYVTTGHVPGPVAAAVSCWMQCQECLIADPEAGGNMRVPEPDDPGRK